MASAQDLEQAGRKTRGAYTKWTRQDLERLMAADDEYQLRIKDQVVTRSDWLVVYLDVMTSVLDAIGKSELTMEQVRRRVADLKGHRPRQREHRLQLGMVLVEGVVLQRLCPHRRHRGEARGPLPPRTEGETKLIIDAIQAESPTEGQADGRSRRMKGLVCYLSKPLADPVEKAVLE